MIYAEIFWNFKGWKPLSTFISAFDYVYLYLNYTIQSIDVINYKEWCRVEKLSIILSKRNKNCQIIKEFHLVGYFSYSVSNRLK